MTGGLESSLVEQQRVKHRAHSPAALAWLEMLCCCDREDKKVPEGRWCARQVLGATKAVLSWGQADLRCATEQCGTECHGKAGGITGRSPKGCPGILTQVRIWP